MYRRTTLLEVLNMDRKEKIKILGKHLGIKPKYLGVPSFAYEVEILPLQGKAQ